MILFKNSSQVESVGKADSIEVIAHVLRFSELRVDLEIGRAHV